MTVFVNAIMYYKVANATHAVANVDDYSGSARLLAATTLRQSGRWDLIQPKLGKFLTRPDNLQ